VTEIGERSAEPLETIQRWVLRAGLFLLPLAYTWNTYDRWVLPKLLLGRLLVIVLLALLVARVLVDRRLVLKRTPLDLPIAAFLASAALSTAFATNLNVAIFGIYSRYDGLLTLLTYAALFWLAVQTLEGPEDAAALLCTLVASAYVVAAVAIVQEVVETSQQGSPGHAYGTFGQWNVLGSFLAIGLALALWELATARSKTARLLALNAVLVIGIALVLTFSRSSWVGAGIGAAVVVAGATSWHSRRALLVGAAAVVSAVILVGGLALAGGTQLESALASRAQTVVHPAEWGPRLLIWRDSLKVIASRPILGYGPDSFGLVFPRYNAVYYHEPIDKAHAETLQIAATQGLVGLAAYLWLLVGFVTAVWRGRKMPGAYAVLGAFLGYQATLQVNFTALGSAFPFWIFAAAAMHFCGAVWTSNPVRIPDEGLVPLRLGLAVLAALAVVGVAFPLIADVRLLGAVEADREGNAAEARNAAGQALLLSPRESVYAVEVGNIAFERGEWANARANYGLAAQLGTYNPLVYRNLAFADRNLGLLSEARAAALAAYELNRYDPANQAVLAQFGGPGP
jgi:putative inorganic carbon (HCO3(-)) transporter